MLDLIAITDHNTIDFAQQLHQELGDKIIVGEEITTTEGEIIGLYLKQTIPAGLDAEQAIHAIQKQGGLVYAPHPYETVRKGMSAFSMDANAAEIDIVEAYNGRAVFQNKSQQAVDWATTYTVPIAAASDSHGAIGWGRTYTILSELPTRKTLIDLLASAEYRHRSPGMIGLLYPKFNRLRKKGRR